MTTTKEKLDLIRLLSAIESALMVSKTDLPDYLWERITQTCERLENDLLESIPYDQL